ncbi:Dal4p [Sugiyamaella lignohabitans]|uniref:Dal4p n=1 Tax=Sugiyamaella lignohabitans TaxID=796027 RepID=A0A167F215_9ASCO|nr:Dal4p [Sugiyamaella lignohabitans]ANB14724.1 Dal4p [Sugiyamaella lignohabitans]
MSGLRNRVSKAASTVKEYATSKKKWALEKQTSSLAPEKVWTNIDNDVTPLSRRTWTTWTVLGFWFSDGLNIQGWESPSSVIAVGLTWREALICNAFGMLIIVVPLTLNGAIGSFLHVPFPIAVRSAFGYRFGKFAVIVRMVTALFWHSIQTYSGSLAFMLCIIAIWPSFLNVPNHIPESVGITTQQMVCQFLFWSIQLPILLISPHKIKWFFILKAIMVTFCCIGVAAAMCSIAGDTGAIFHQEPKVHGSKKAWLILNCMMSSAGGWATMATNIPDFTRYMRGTRGQWWQGLFLPVISLFLAAMAILATSASGVIFRTYIWDPTQLPLKWTGPGGRAGMFFVGLSWAIAQIGTNLTANVITAANDLSSLCPKYINIRRGAIIVTVIGGWIMQPWKIISSAQSLLTFMSGLAVFLAPIAAMLATDFWLVKRKCIDVAALYDPDGIYKYWHGMNWRALVSFLIGLGPNLPGLAKAVSPGLNISGGILHVYDINYFYGFYTTALVYFLLSYFWPAKETVIPAPMLADGIIYGVDPSHDSEEDTVEKVSYVTNTQEKV